jgi:hypothetical protein
MRPRSARSTTGRPEPDERRHSRGTTSPPGEIPPGRESALPLSEEQERQLKQLLPMQSSCSSSNPAVGEDSIAEDPTAEAAA